jgi:hypothetical protein
MSTGHGGRSSSSFHRQGERREGQQQQKKSLSAKAQALLSELKSNVPEQQSEYIEKMVENAEYRRKQAELAYEKKLLEELNESNEGKPQMTFITKGYEEKMGETINGLGDEGREMERLKSSLLFMNAERIDSAAAPASAAAKHEKEKHNKLTSSLASSTYVDAEELIRRRNARRAARVAPPSRITQEMILAATKRAKIRLGFPA